MFLFENIKSSCDIFQYTLQCIVLKISTLGKHHLFSASLQKYDNLYIGHLPIWNVYYRV
jgi:hypothetical protein